MTKDEIIAVMKQAVEVLLKTQNYIQEHKPNNDLWFRSRDSQKSLLAAINKLEQTNGQG